MNKKLTGVIGLSVAMLAAGFLALTGSGAATVASADGGAPSVEQASALPEIPVDPNLDPLKVAWENQVAADQAANAAAWADPAIRDAVLAKKAAVDPEVPPQPQPQDMHDNCVVDVPVGAPPMSSLDFRSTSGGVKVINNECVVVYVGYLGLDHPGDGGIFVTYRPVEGDVRSNMWQYPGQGPLTMVSLTDSGIVTVAPATGPQFTVDISQG